MMRRMLVRPAVVLSMLARLARAQMGDTVTLSVGDPSIDGRYLTPHRAAMVVTVTKDGATVSSRSYLLDKFVTRWRGRPAFRLVLHAPPDAPDPMYRIESVLDRRTMALLHREERDGAGRFAIYDVDGARLTGRVQSGAGAAAESLDVALAQPSFLSVFVDAAINASPVRAGRVFRVPTFDVIGRRTEWHVFHVTGRDSAAWVIQEDSTARVRRRRIWLTREPPFFPLDITDLPDGSVRRIAQTLVRGTS
jgi:hypothetical protein